MPEAPIVVDSDFPVFLPILHERSWEQVVGRAEINSEGQIYITLRPDDAKSWLKWLG